MNRYLFKFFCRNKKTIDKLIFDKISISFLISFIFSGKKPKKINLSEKPLIDIADITEDGPGIEKIFIFLFNCIH